MTNYFQTINLHKKLIVAVAILCGILSFVFAKFYPTTYTVSTLLAIHRVNKETTSDFQYDNYYGIQATEFVGNTVVSYLQSPETILEIYKETKLDQETKNIFSETKKFRPKQLSSHLIKLRITSEDNEKAKKLVQAAVEVINGKVKKLETNVKNQNSFEISATESIISTNKYSPFFVGGLGLICGLFLGVGFAFLFVYFKEEGK